MVATAGFHLEANQVGVALEHLAHRRIVEGDRQFVGAGLHGQGVDGVVHLDGAGTVAFRGFSGNEPAGRRPRIDAGDVGPVGPVQPEGHRQRFVGPPGVHPDPESHRVARSDPVHPMPVGVDQVDGPDQVVVAQPSEPALNARCRGARCRGARCRLVGAVQETVDDLG